MADVVVDVDMVVGSEVAGEETQVMAAMAPVTGAPVAMEVVEVEVTEEDVEEEEATETAGTGSVEMVDMAEEAPMEVREVMAVDRVATEVAREAMEEQEVMADTERCCRARPRKQPANKYCTEEQLTFPTITITILTFHVSTTTRLSELR